jgi:hypothetical protein
LLGRRDNSPVPFDERLAERLRELTANYNGIREMSMFGGRAYLLNGNLAVGASGEGGLIVRVDPSETVRLLPSPHAAPFLARGRTMDGWIRVNGDGVRTKRQLERSVMLGISFAGTLPPKNVGGRRRAVAESPGLAH